MTGRTSPNSLQPDVQGADVDSLGFIRVVRRCRMMVTVAGRQMRKIGCMFRRDARSRQFHACGGGLLYPHLRLLTH